MTKDSPEIQGSRTMTTKKYWDDNVLMIRHHLNNVLACDALPDCCRVSVLAVQRCFERELLAMQIKEVER
jgi:hypothetical protein